MGGRQPLEPPRFLRQCCRYFAEFQYECRLDCCYCGNNIMCHNNTDNATGYNCYSGNRFDKDLLRLCPVIIPLLHSPVALPDSNRVWRSSIKFSLLCSEQSKAVPLHTVVPPPTTVHCNLSSLPGQTHSLSTISWPRAGKLIILYSYTPKRNSKWHK